MLLKDFRLEIINNQCMPGAISVNCFAHLEQDVSEAIPYLNAVLGGFEYIKDPPMVTFRAQGKLITVHGNKIAINALRDQAEAQKIIEWLKKEINEVWQMRDTIEPCYEGAPKPSLVEILKRLPRTNCKQCGEPTCMVFAVRLAEGAKGPEACTALDAKRLRGLEVYLCRFALRD